MFKSIVFFWILLISSISYGSDSFLRNISEAACRVTAGNNCGSGTAVHIDEQSVYVLTNAHVTENYRAANVEFWKYGRKVDKPISGRVIWKIKNGFLYDFSIIQIPKTSFKSLPKIAKFIPIDYNLTQNQYCATAGSPRSEWLSIKEGYVLSIDNTSVKFYPIPQDGQSGSALFVNINNKPYIAGVITGRTGNLARDQNGFSVNHGYAIHINQLRKSLNNNVKYKKVLKNTVYLETKNGIQVALGKLYALGDDGKYYIQNEDGSVNVPPGTKIIKWNQSGPNGMQPIPRPILPNPRTTAPPLTQPQNGQSRPDYGSLPPGFGEPDDTTEDKTEELEAEIAKLKSDLENCLGEKEQLKLDLEQKQNELEVLKVQIVQLEEYNKDKDGKIEELQKSISELNLKIDSKNEEIEKYKISISELIKKVEQQDTVIIERPITKDEPSFIDKAKTFFSRLNPLWYLLIGAGCAILFFKRRVLSKIPFIIGSWFNTKHDVVDDIKNNTNDSQLKDALDHLQKSFKHLDAKIDASNDHFSNKINEVSSKINQNTVNTNINIDNDDNDGNNNDSTDFDHSKYKADPDCLDRIKQLFELKKRDGESVEQWAFYALLYREAMQLLRKGEFVVKVNGNGITLQGQKIAADKIDKWVEDQYVKRMTIEKIQLHHLYHEAMIGFLYKEAVQRLRLGYFQSLGNKEIADAIESWVKKEFLNRMGIRL